MRILALDIGQRHTGLAWYDDAVDIPLPLDTIHHRTADALATALLAIAAERNPDLLLIGLPRLPDGSEGKQARIVRSVGQRLRKGAWSVRYFDERYTTGKQREVDPDAVAACELLTTYLAGERARTKRERNE